MNHHILWADDEIDLLKPHILFLEKKGYQVTPVNSGSEAVDLSKEQLFDIVFLDENMPGLSGLEALAQIKEDKPDLPVIMITKSEEEYIMEEAIGAKIADYLIKPINPNQILLSIKKVLDNSRLITEKTNQSYQQEFQKIRMACGDDMDHDEWADLYKKIIYWELRIDETENKSMKEVMEMQKTEANANFAKFIMNNYQDWLNNSEVFAPILSHEVFEVLVSPHIQEEEKLFVIVIDNLRFDQWKMISSLIQPYYKVDEEEIYYSILPTTTQYARNAFFSGMLPLDMAKAYPEWWSNDEDEGGKNLHEDDFLREQLKRLNLPTDFNYSKVITLEQGKEVLDNFNNLIQKDLNVVIYNFVDMLSHARTEMNLIKELAPDEMGYRSITKSWFANSPLLELIKRLHEKKIPIVITTDHGTAHVKKPVKIIGDKDTNTNLRYKQGKRLKHDDKSIFEVKEPSKLFLPQQNVSTSYAFTTGDGFFAYPNNYNYYVNYYKDTFQHGGISLEEILIPCVKLSPK